MLKTELEKMRVCFDRIEPIRSKDGVHVARVFCGKSTAVLKAFEKQEYRREVENYRILRSLGVQTLQILAETDAAILMEDVDASPVLRLGAENDHADPVLAQRLAQWYLALHERGSAYVQEHGAQMYDETDCITAENLALVRDKTGTGSLPVWKEIDSRLDDILQAVHALARTLTYNDFYYTNLIAARDKSFAFMYDYNLLGKGYVLSDVRNVTASLQGDAAAAFEEAYGAIDPAQEAVDAVACTLSTLVMACFRPVFPKWAASSVDRLSCGLSDDLRRLLERS